MKHVELRAVRRGFLIILSMALLSLAAQGFAQTQPSGAPEPAAQPQAQTTQKTTTTTSTRTEQTAQQIDPIWFVVGGIALIGILLVVILAARGRRGRDIHTHVSERTTVVKKE